MEEDFSISASRKGPRLRVDPSKDKGCRVSKACLECPLPSCVYGTKAAWVHNSTWEIKTRLAKGESIESIMDSYKLSRRRVLDARRSGGSQCIIG